MCEMVQQYMPNSHLVELYCFLFPFSIKAGWVEHISGMKS